MMYDNTTVASNPRLTTIDTLVVIPFKNLGLQATEPRLVVVFIHYCRAVLVSSGYLSQFLPVTFSVLSMTSLALFRAFSLGRFSLKAFQILGATRRAIFTAGCWFEDWSLTIYTFCIHTVIIPHKVIW